MLNLWFVFKNFLKSTIIMSILLFNCFIFAIGNSSNITIKLFFMYRLMISFHKEDVLKSVWSQPKEYYLPNADEVCKVITSLSHLVPVITLCQIKVLSASDVLKDFESKQI